MDFGIKQLAANSKFSEEWNLENTSSEIIYKKVVEPDATRKNGEELKSLRVG
jgi:hypothetical protein